MGKSCFNYNSAVDRPDWSSADLLSSLPKDWLHLGPPCPTPYDAGQPHPNFASGPETLFNDQSDSLSSRADVLTPRQFVSYPLDFQDVQNHSQFSTFFGSQDCYLPPPLPSSPSQEWYFPLYAWPSSSPTLVHAPSYYQPLISFENPSSQDESPYSSTYPSTMQDFLSGTIHSSPSNAIFGEDNVKDNAFPGQTQVSQSDFSTWPEFKDTEGNLPFEGIFDGKLHRAEKGNNPNDNTWLKDQGLEVVSKSYAQQQPESSMPVEQTLVSGLDIASTTIGVDHLYLGCQCSEDLSSNYDRDNLEANAKAPSLDQLQGSLEFAALAFGETASCQTDTTVSQTNLSASKGGASGLASFPSCSSTVFGDKESNSRNSPTTFLSILTEFLPTNIQGLKVTAQVPEGISSPPLSMEGGENSTLLSMDHIGAKHQKSSVMWDRSTPDSALCFSAIEGQVNAVTDMQTKHMPYFTSSWLSPMIDISSDYMSEISKSIPKSERKEDNVVSDSSSKAGHALTSSKTAHLSSPIENTFAVTAASFTPVEDILYSECHLPISSEALSFSSTENEASVSIPQVVKSLPGCDNLELFAVSDFIVCRSYETTNSCGFPKSGTAVEWPERVIEDAVDATSNTGVEFATNGDLGYPLNMCTLEHVKADPLIITSNTMASDLKISVASGEPLESPQSSSAGSAKYHPECPEPRNCGSDFLASVIDCHMLVESIQNSSLLLIASHFSGSDNLTESDIQALQSVICNLSQFLVQKAGLSASSIQVTSQPDQAQVAVCSGSSQKGSQLDRSYSRENSDADCSLQELKGSSTFSADGGIGIAEEAPNTTQFLAESSESQKIDPNQEVLQMKKPFGPCKETQSERTLSELQKLMDKLREDFASELEERDTAVLLYKNLWSEAQAELASMKIEMKHTKMELEALKQKRYAKGETAFGIREGEISEIKGSAKSEGCLEVILNPEENVWDRAAILLSREKSHEDPDKKVSSLPESTTHADTKETAFQERAAILLSRERDIGESDMSWFLKPCDRDMLQVGRDAEVCQRGEILARFKALQECNSHSDVKRRDLCNPLDLGIDDRLGLCDNSLDVKEILMENSVDESNLVSYKSNIGHKRTSIQDTGFGTNENAYPDTDEVQTRLAVLQGREALQGRIKGHQNIAISDDIEKQPSSTLAVGKTQNVIKHACDAEEFSNSSRVEISTRNKMGGIEQFLHTISTSDCCSDSNQLTDRPTVHGQLESSYSGQMSDSKISNQPKLLYCDVPLTDSVIESSFIKLIDAFTANKSSTERKAGNVCVTGGCSKALFSSSLATQKQDPEEINTFTGIHIQSSNYPPEHGVEAGTDNEDWLGGILHWQHEDSSVTACTEGESSSTESDSSWEHLVTEEDTMLH